MAKKECQDCGGEYEAKGVDSRFCPSCRKKRQSETAKKHNLCYIGGGVCAERRSEKAEKKDTKKAKPKEAICDSFCDGCAYKGYVEGLRMCRYLLVTGKRRPCPPGNGCTVKETGKRKHKWREEDDATWKSRKAEQEKKRQEEARVRKAKREKPVLVITCVICGKQFATTDGRRKCCSPECTDTSRKWIYRRYDEKRGRRNEKQAKSATGIVSSEAGSTAQAKAGNPDGN